MKAAQINQYGSSDFIELNENTQNPSVKEAQLLVEVGAASLNPFDWKILSGSLKDMISLAFPATLIITHK